LVRTADKFLDRFKQAEDSSLLKQSHTLQQSHTTNESHISIHL